MKLLNLYKESSKDDLKSKYNIFGEWLKKKVKERVMAGESKLKKLFLKSDLTLDHVRYAIKHGECLKNPDPKAKALGPTYLEQTIANIIRDLYQDRQIPWNHFDIARSYFGLEVGDKPFLSTNKSKYDLQSRKRRKR